MWFRSFRFRPIALLLWPLLTGGCGVVSHLESADTTGLARGVAEHEGLAFIADGIRGLAIIDVRMALQPVHTGTLDLPGFNSRVATDGAFALLNDEQSSSLYVVDVSAPAQPALVATYQAPAPVREIAVDDGFAVLVARSDDPGGAEGFDGLVAISYGSGPPATLGTLSLPGAADVGLRGAHLWAIAGERLVVFPRVSGALAPSAVGDLKIPGESLQSLDVRPEPFVALLGKSLHVVDASTPAAPQVVDQQVVAGNATGRVVTASEVVTRTWSGEPYLHLFAPITVSGFVVSYSTQDEYGRGWVVGQTGEILHLFQAYSVKQQSKGSARLYDIAMRSEVGARIGAGGTAVVGALDNHGLVYEWWEIVQVGKP